MDDLVKSLRAARNDLESRLNLIRREAESLKADMDAIDRVLKRYEGQRELLINPGQAAFTATDFVGKTLRESIILVLRQQYPRSMRAGEIASRLKEGGYVTRSLNFEQAVFAILSDLVKSEKVERPEMGQYRCKPIENKNLQSQ